MYTNKQWREEAKKESEGKEQLKTGEIMNALMLLYPCAGDRSPANDLQYHRKLCCVQDEVSQEGRRPPSLYYIFSAASLYNTSCTHFSNVVTLASWFILPLPLQPPTFIRFPSDPKTSE